MPLPKQARATSLMPHFWILSSHNYNVIALAELIEAKLKKEELPRNTVVVTFDDGYADNFYDAYPVLKEHNLPATIFVIVDSAGEEGYLKIVDRTKDMLIVSGFKVYSVHVEEVMTKHPDIQIVTKSKSI